MDPPHNRDAPRIRPEIRDFYEHTSGYRLEAWSEAPLPTRLFLWALTRFVSRRMDQLNFPVSSLELAGGMTSEVLPMVDADGRRHFTGWLRRVAASERVIYTGLYSVQRPVGYRDPCVKVSFPAALRKLHRLPPSGGAAGRLLQADLFGGAVRRAGLLSDGRSR